MLSRYGESATKHMLGLVIVSGMPLYTLAAIVESVVCNGVRMSASIVIGTLFQHLKMGLKARLLCYLNFGLK